MMWLVLHCRVGKAVGVARTVGDINHRYPRAGSPYQGRQPFSAFGGDGMAQEDEIEITILELKDRFSYRACGRDEISGSLPD